MTRKEKGILGETKVLLYLIENKYEVFLPYADNGSFDLIAYKDKITYRVSIKYTAYKDKDKWVVGLRNQSRRNHGQVITKLFDNTSCDILAVYIHPEDRVILFNSIDILNKSEIRISAF